MKLYVAGVLESYRPVYDNSIYRDSQLQEKQLFSVWLKDTEQILSFHLGVLQVL